MIHFNIQKCKLACVKLFGWHIYNLIPACCSFAYNLENKKRVTFNVILNELFVLQTTNSIKCYYPTLFFSNFITLILQQTLMCVFAWPYQTVSFCKIFFKQFWSAMKINTHFYPSWKVLRIAIWIKVFYINDNVKR